MTAADVDTSPAVEVPAAPFLSDTPGSWAVIEIMGHRQHAGKVSEERIANQTFLRVDALCCTVAADGETRSYEAEVHYYSPASVFCLTPCTEARAMAAATRRYAPRPLGELTASYPIDDADDEDWRD